MEEKTFNFCPFCGAELEESNLFCTACGNDVKREIPVTFTEEARGMKWYYYMIVTIAFEGVANIISLFTFDRSGVALTSGGVGLSSFYVLWHLLKRKKACSHLMLYFRMANFSIPIVLFLYIPFATGKTPLLVTSLISSAIIAVAGYFFIINEQKWFKNRINIFKN